MDSILIIVIVISVVCCFVAHRFSYCCGFKDGYILAKKENIHALKFPNGNPDPGPGDIGSYP